MLLTCPLCSVANPAVPNVVVCTSLAVTSPVKSPVIVAVAVDVSITVVAST